MLLTGQLVLGCDICGCASGGTFSGIYPQFESNIIGLQYNQQRLTHPFTPLNFNGDSRVLRDDYHQYTLWGRFFVKPRVQVLAFLPVSQNIRRETERNTSIDGISDLTLMANYTVINTGDSLYPRVKQALLLGGGVQLPIGKYQQRDENMLILPPNFQVGTGAFSYILHANYTVRYGQLGINMDYQYRINDENERTYRFGNSHALVSNLFYKFKAGKNAALLPSAGISYEHYARDTEFGREKETTGGDFLFANLGVDYVVKRYFLRAFVQQPLSQNLPMAQPSTGPRFGVSVSLVF